MTRLRRILLLVLLAASLLGSDCGADDRACVDARQCESYCGQCTPACLPTGPQGEGQCHCSCQPQK
ncbi:MAG: hypothetical protein KC503_42170 [Myxococcales bacterium]|nr:hypothetical protein [Myxococcales bacterium]